MRTQRGIDPERPQWTADVDARRRRRDVSVRAREQHLRVAAPLGPNWRPPSSWPAGWRTDAFRSRATGTWVDRAPCAATAATRRAATRFGARGSSWRTAGRRARRGVTDVGRAGPREQLSLARPLIGVGVGASFVDGLIRLMSRALSGLRPVGVWISILTQRLICAAAERAPSLSRMTSTAAPVTDLKRELGLLDAVMINVGTMIASAIFIVPATVAALVTGSGAMWLAWVSGVVSLLGAFVHRRAQRGIPGGGGQLPYLRAAYGPLWGFLYGWANFLVINPAPLPPSP